MILMTGGAYQGALECAQNIGKAAENTAVADGRTSGIQEALNSRIWDHVTDWMKRQMKEGRTPDEIRADVDDLLEKIRRLF